MPDMKPTILAIDDDPEFIDSLRFTLNEFGRLERAFSEAFQPPDLWAPAPGFTNCFPVSCSGHPHPPNQVRMTLILCGKFVNT